MWRYTEGKLDRAPALAAELVRLKVDIIVSSGPTLTNVLKEATTTIPIVMGYHTDPVGTRLIASLARPGGNITGLSVLSPELGKRLEILKEVVPKLSRVAILGSSTLPGNAEMLKETELAAGALGVKLQFVDVLSPKDIEAAFQRTVEGRADAVLAQGSGVLNAHRTQVADLAVKSRLPAMYYVAEFVEAGGLCSMAWTFSICTGAPLRMWTRSSKAQSRLSFRWSNRRNSSSSSISKPPNRSA